MGDAEGVVTVPRRVLRWRGLTRAAGAAEADEPAAREVVDSQAPDSPVPSESGLRQFAAANRLRVPASPMRAPARQPDAAADVAPPDDEGSTGVDRELEALFQEFFRSRGSVAQTAMGVWRPPTDVFETADHVVVKMEVAGVRKVDLDVTFEERCLRIRGRREEHCTGKKVAVSQMEVEYGVFERHISIPHPVDADRIEASYGDGFLVIRIPKLRVRQGSVVAVVL